MLNVYNMYIQFSHYLKRYAQHFKLCLKLQEILMYFLNKCPYKMELVGKINLNNLY